MEEKPLSIYLNDHLAGSVAGIELAESCLEKNAGTPLGNFLAGLIEEIREDQAVLKNLIARLSAGESTVKKMSAWMAEKATHLKTSLTTLAGLSRLQELELLVLGIHGKLALWRVLEELQGKDHRLQGVDFRFLQDRARRQMEGVEAERIKSIPAAFL